MERATRDMQFSALYVFTNVNHQLYRVTMLFCVLGSLASLFRNSVSHWNNIYNDAGDLSNQYISTAIVRKQTGRAENNVNEIDGIY